MAIYIGGKSLRNVYVGNKAVRQVFKGSTLLWERSGITVSQNTGTSSSKLAVKGASATITVSNTTGAWTVTVGASWLTASVTNGNGPGTFTVTAASNVHTTSDRNTTVTVKQTSSGKTATVTIYQSADSKNVSYGNVTAGTITNTTIPASGTTTNYTATAGNGSQVITYTWASDGASAGSETKTIAPSVASISATASSKGTTTSGVTTVKSQAVTWTGYGGKSASGTMYIYQEANTKSTAVYDGPFYQGGTTTYGNVTAGSITPTSVSDISAAGGTVTFTAGKGSQTWSTSAYQRRYRYKDSWTSGAPTDPYYGSWETVTAASSGTNQVSPDATTKSISGSHLGTTQKARTSLGSVSFTWSGGGGKSASASSTTVYQAANTRTLSSVYIVPYQPDSSWIVTVSNGNWNTCPASGGYVKCHGYANYTHTSGSPLNDQYITSDAGLSWSTGYNSWITNHSNGGYYIANRGTETGDARSSTATWTYGGKTSAGKTLTQQANQPSVTGYGSWEGPSSWGSWADYDYPYGDTHGNWQADCLIGFGINCAGGSATVYASAAHTIYHWKRQRRSGTQYRDIYYTWTSGGTWTHDNGSSQTVYDYQQVANGTTAVSDPVSLAIVSNGNNRFSLSDTTLYHYYMGNNVVTDSCTVRVTNTTAAANNVSAYKDDTISVTNTLNSTTRSISASSTSVAGTGGSITITYNSVNTYCAGNVDTASTLSVDTSGCTLSKTSISGSGTATLTIPQNPYSSARTIKVTIAGGNTVSITQASGARYCKGIGFVNYSEGGYTGNPLELYYQIEGSYGQKAYGDWYLAPNSSSWNINKVIDFRVGWLEQTDDEGLYAVRVYASTQSYPNSGERYSMDLPDGVFLGYGEGTNLCLYDFSGGTVNTLQYFCDQYNIDPSQYYFWFEMGDYL